MRQTCVVAGVIQIGRIQSNLDSEKMAYIVSGPYFLSAPLICELGNLCIDAILVVELYSPKENVVDTVIDDVAGAVVPVRTRPSFDRGAVLVRVTGIIHFCAVLDGNAPAEEVWHRCRPTWRC